MSLRNVCGVLFWIKVLVAVLISITLIGLQSYIVYQKYTNAKKNDYFREIGAEI